MNDFIIKKISDINSDYPYLCLYFQSEKEPFMEIVVNKNDEYELVFYSHKKNITINSIQLAKIIKSAESFTKEILSNKDFY